MAERVDYLHYLRFCCNSLSYSTAVPLAKLSSLPATRILLKQLTGQNSLEGVSGVVVTEIGLQQITFPLRSPTFTNYPHLSTRVSTKTLFENWYLFTTSILIELTSLAGPGNNRDAQRSFSSNHRHCAKSASSYLEIVEMYRRKPRRR